MLPLEELKNKPLKELSIAEVNALARAEKLTYGQYVIQHEDPHPLKIKKGLRKNEL